MRLAWRILRCSIVTVFGLSAALFLGLAMIGAFGLLAATAAAAILIVLFVVEPAGTTAEVKLAATNGNLGDRPAVVASQGDEPDVNMPPFTSRRLTRAA